MTEYKNYVIYISRQIPNSKKRNFYFLTEDNKLSGRLEDAKIYPRYGDTFEPSWDGILWQNDDRLKELGFCRISSMPYTEIKKHIKPEWRANDVVDIIQYPYSSGRQI